jgi:hypothetical protein
MYVNGRIALYILNFGNTRKLVVILKFRPLYPGKIFQAWMDSKASVDSVELRKYLVSAENCTSIPLVA